MPAQRLDDGSFRHFCKSYATATAIDNNFIIGVGLEQCEISSPSPIRVLLPISIVSLVDVLNQSSYRFDRQHDKTAH